MIGHRAPLRTTDLGAVDGPELDRVIGPEAASATMEFLPPVPWDVLREQGVDRLLLEATP